MNRLPVNSRMRLVCETLDRTGPVQLSVLLKQTDVPYDTLKKCLKRLKDRGAVQAEMVKRCAIYSVVANWREILDRPEPEKEQAPEPFNTERGRLTQHLHRAWPQPIYYQGA